jgi:hypothetical protein
VVAKYYLVGFQFPRLKWEKATEVFERETGKLADLVAPLSREEAQKKVLVPKMRGLEDASRNWSPAMVIEHLMIAAPGMGEIATQLTQGRAPSIEVDIAKIKPTGKPFEGQDGKKIVEAFTRKMKETSEKIGRDARDRSSTFKHVHPWFGPINAHQWNWLMASHQMIHRRQLEKILSR